MSYTVYEDVVTRYPMMANIAATPTIVNSNFIFFAEVELNGRLASNFTVPFDPAPPTIEDLAIDLTYYRMERMRDPEKAEKIHDAVIGRIENIKKGDEYIYTGSGTTILPSLPTQTGEFWSSDMDYHPVHSMLGAEDALTQVDSNQLSDLEQERE